MSGKHSGQNNKSTNKAKKNSKTILLIIFIILLISGLISFIFLKNNPNKEIKKTIDFTFEALKKIIKMKFIII